MRLGIGRSRRVLLVTAVGMLLIAGGVVLVVRDRSGGGSGSQGTDAPTTCTSTAPTTTTVVPSTTAAPTTAPVETTTSTPVSTSTTTTTSSTVVPTSTSTSTTVAHTTTTVARTTTTVAHTTPPTSPPPTTVHPTVPPTTVTPTTTPGVTPAVAVWRGNTSRRNVAMTFDAGSDTGYAAKILDILAANGVPASFGITGRWAELNPSLIRRMVADGHRLVNHTYDHKSFTGASTGTAPLTCAQRIDEITHGEAAIRAAGGTPTIPWFRPPYGDENASVRADIALAGYRYELMWTIDSTGWKGVAPNLVAQHVLQAATPGAIIVFHVGSASTDHAALQTIIDGLRAAGYGFVTVDHLL